MKRVVTLLLAALAGLVLAGLVVGLLVPASPSRSGPGTALAVTLGSVTATMAVAVFAMLAERHRRDFFRARTLSAGDRRQAECFDLAGVARDPMPLGSVARAETPRSHFVRSSASATTSGGAPRTPSSAIALRVEVAPGRSL